MSHEIYYNPLTGKDSFMAVATPAWHQLGQVPTEAPEDYHEVMDLCQANFTVASRLNSHTLPSGEVRDAVDSYFLYRTDTNDVLGEHVTAEYYILQNKELFAAFDKIVKSDKGIKYETAGVLNSGQIFVTATLPDYIRIGKSDDVITKHLFLTSGHNGKVSARLALTPVRIVCNNTLTAAMKNSSNEFVIKHTEKAPERLNLAVDLTIENLALFNEYSDIYNQWATIKIDDRTLVDFIKEIFAPSPEVLRNVKLGMDDELSQRFKNHVQRVFEFYMTADTLQMDTTRGKLWGAYNLVSDYYQNVAKFKTSEEKFNSIMFGLPKTRVQKAFDWCAKFAKRVTGN